VLFDLLTDERSRNAVVTAEAWTRGEVALDDVRAAYAAARAAASSYASIYAAAAHAATLLACAKIVRQDWTIDEFVGLFEKEQK